MAYISGCASLVAVATVWLLTITPLPASFFWPGVLLPASIMAMVSGGAKFLFFDASICTEELWFAEGATDPVGHESNCQMGDSAVYGIASVAAYFLCTIVICIRSPTKRVLNPHYGNRINAQAEDTLDSEQINVPAAELDPELGDVTSNEAVIHRANPQSKNDTCDETVLSPPSSPPQQIDVAKGAASEHVRTTSDVSTWSAGSPQLALPIENSTRDVRVLSPARPAKDKATDESMQIQSDMVWDSAFGVFMTVDDESRFYFEGKTQKRSNLQWKSPERQHADLKWKSPERQQPLASSIRTGRSVRQIKQIKETPSDSGSVCSRISKVSFAETHFSEESFSSSASAPSVVSIPKKIVPTPSHKRPPGLYSHINSSPNKLRYTRREDRNDVSENPRIDSRRERFEHLPRLDELASPKSNSDDHGDLINQCLHDLHKSFGGKEGYGTL